MSAAPQPQLLDADARRLFAVFHATDGAPRAGVLVCPPFLHEHALSYRLFALLGDALAAQNVAMLRFDYHGAGDSAGDDQAFSLDGARRDAALALAALRERIGGAPVVVLGARAGAFIATALADASNVRGLWLWEPVTDGAKYLAGLRELDRSERQSSRRYPNGGGERAWKVETLIGFAFGDTQQREIESARLVVRENGPPVTLLERSSHATPISAARRIELAPGLGEWADRVDIEHFPLPAVRDLAARLAASPGIA